MKSGRILLISFFSSICICLNAQVFVGGSARLVTHNTENERTTPPYKSSNFELDLRPSMGKFLSEKIAIGLALNVSFDREKSDGLTETISKSSSIGISPFLRYYALKWNKFSVYGQGNIGLEFSNSSVKTEANTTDGPKNTLAYFSIYPGVSYDLTDKLSLQTSLNILSLEYNYVITKDGSSKDKSSNLNIGAGLGNIVSIGAITIGAIYKF